MGPGLFLRPILLWTTGRPQATCSARSTRCTSVSGHAWSSDTGLLALILPPPPPRPPPPTATSGSTAHRDGVARRAVEGVAPEAAVLSRRPRKGGGRQPSLSAAADEGGTNLPTSSSTLSSTSSTPFLKPTSRMISSVFWKPSHLPDQDTEPLPTLELPSTEKEEVYKVFINGASNNTTT